MLAWQKAEQWQRENDATADFSELLGQHLSTGVVHSTPQLFMLAGEVRWNTEEKHFEDGEPNCWFVRLAASIGCANAPWGLMRVSRMRTNMWLGFAAAGLSQGFTIGINY